MSVSEDKKSIRRDAQRLRTTLAQSAPDAAQAIADNFMRAISIAPDAVVAGYVVTRFEADPLPLMERLRANGHPLALARVAAKNRPLAFHLWQADTNPVEGAFGLTEASPEWPSTQPEIVLVPLLGFDRSGYRLGYGGGFYDRTLQALRAQNSILAVGIAFAGQEMILPRDEYDEPLDWVVTECYARKFERI